MSAQESDEKSAVPAQLVGVTPNKQIWPMRTVTQITSLGASQIYTEINKGNFPTPVQLSRGRVGWVVAEVLAWIDQRKAERDQLLIERNASVRAAHHEQRPENQNEKHSTKSVATCSKTLSADRNKRQSWKAR